MVLRSTPHDYVVILDCSGRLQSSDEIATFSKMAQRILNAGLDLVLDFQDLEAIGSTGIGELVLLSMSARAAEKEVTIALPQTQVLEALNVANVSSLFRICWSLDDALGMSSEVA